MRMKMNIRKRFLSICLAFLMVFSMVPAMTFTAGAATIGDADGTYDFGLLQPGNYDENGTFKTQGDKFLVSNCFANDGNVIYANGTTADTFDATQSIVIKANGGLCKKFTFKDLALSHYGNEQYLDVFNITLKRADGSTIATHSLKEDVASFPLLPIYLDNTINISTFDFTNPFAVGGYDDVSEIVISYRLEGSGNKPINVVFHSITIANVSSALAPTATTIAASGISSTGATLNGSVNDNGANTTVTFDYGTTTGYGTNVAATTNGTVSAGAGSTAVAKSLTGLAPSTTYHYRVNGTNSAGTTNGGDLTFTTSAAVNNAPVASAVNITGTAQVGQTLSGSYTYTDAENDTDASTFKWYRANDASGTGASAIASATSSTYTLTADDLGKFICFEVTPVASSGTSPGTAVKSNYTSAVAAAAGGADEPTTLQTVDFETEGSGYTVTGGQTTSVDRWWARTDGTTVSSDNAFTGKQGTYYFYGEDTDGGRTTDDPVYVTLNSVNVSGYSNLQIKILVAGHNNPDSGYEATEYLKIQYAYDGEEFLNRAQFIAAETAAHCLSEDTDVNGFTDGSSLSPAFTEYTYNIPSAGTNLQIRLAANINTTREEIGFDNIRIIGTAISASNTAPTVSGVSISGTAQVAQQLTGSYTFQDVNGDSDSSTYKWYRYTNTSGGGEQEISGATSKTYTLTPSDLGKYIKFEVIPYDGDALGTAVKSGYTAAVTALSATDTWDGTTASGFGGGDGLSEDTAYEIATAEQLAYFRVVINNGFTKWIYGNKYYKLTADIDLNNRQWTPIGTTDDDFYGYFNGNGHKISNLVIGTVGSPSTIEYLGLFGRAGFTASAEIKNVGVENVLIYSGYPTEGISSAKVGGLTGYLKGTATNCYATGTIVSSATNTYAGGLIGQIIPATVTNCYANVNITGINGTDTVGSTTVQYTILGGLIGRSYSSSANIITNCYATGNLTAGDDSKVGGLVGQFGSNSFSTITNCYATGTVAGGTRADVGGLVGKNVLGVINYGYWNNAAAAGLGSSTGTLNNSEAKSLAVMKLAAFVDLLNTNDTVVGDTWKADTNTDNQGYPLLIGVGVGVDSGGGSNSAPVASEVNISGTAQVGQTLTGSYTYTDAESDDEGTSTFKWYRADDASGTGASAIASATSKNYTLTADDLGKFICFEVTPYDGTDAGTAVKSSYTAAVAAALTAPSISTQPNNATVNVGGNTSFTVAAVGTGLTYQWWVNNGSGFSYISNTGVYSGATSPTLNITGATSGMNGYIYRVSVIGTVSPPATSNSVTLTVNAAPTATVLAITGTLQVGQTLTGHYTYSDVNGDEQGISTFKWYRSDNSSGLNKTAIEGVTAITYILQSADTAKYISFEVTPVAATGTAQGTAVESARVGAIVPAEASPTATVQAITGTLQVGQTLTGHYTYSDVNGDEQGISTFKWYRSDNASGLNKTAIEGATAITYILQSADTAKYISFEVTPVAETGTAQGTAVESARVGAIAPAAPTATTTAASSITSTGATLNASVNANNASTVVTFDYGTTTGYGSTATALQSPVTGTSSTSVSANILGLVPNTTYHYRVKAVNTAGTTNGLDMTFTTIAIVPTATTTAASSVSATGATLNGSINANNASTVVTFEYGITTAYGSSATALQSPVTGTSNTSVSAAVLGLIPNTIYHYRVKGVNAGGTTYGLNMTFTTPAANTLPVASAVSVTGTAQVGQTLTGNYTYTDAESDPQGASTFKWYRANDAIGTGVALIDGATNSTYTLVEADLGKFICFEVTPVASTGTSPGTAVKSNYTSAVAAALDTTKPIITLLGSASVNVANGAAYTDAGATASDNVDGNITANIVTTISNNVNAGTTFDSTIAAVYTYHYNVSDAASNAADEVTRTVTVAVQTYEVSGNIVQDDSTPAAGATVTIMKGQNIIGTTTTDVNGAYIILNVPNGFYNLVANKDGITITILVVVNGVSEDVGTITLPTGKQNSVVEVKDNTPSVVVGNLDQQFDTIVTDDSKGITEDDKEVIIAGGSVEIKLTAEQKTENTASNSGNIEIVAQLDGKTIGTFLDLKVTKTVTESGGSSTTTQLTELPSLIEILIPLDTSMQGHTDYVIYRYHGTSVDAISTIPNAIGEKIVIADDNKSIKLYVMKFSTYAIGYTDDQSTPPIVISGGGGGSYSTSYIITASVGDGGSISPTSASVTEGSSETFTITPNEGYSISDVLVDSVSVGALSSYTFSNVSSSHTIKALFEKESGLPYYLDSNGKKVFIGFSAKVGNEIKYIAPKGETVLFKENKKSFTDITGHWAKDNIDFVTERELFVGTGDGKVSPETGMTRAMFATVIGRLYERSYGKLISNNKHAFSDVNYDAYYGDYIDWAAENNIITGIGNGFFEPDREITRQEMASILYRFVKFLDVMAEKTDGLVLSYPDSTDIANWATDAALYCQTTGIITGRNGGYFIPQGTATRAEVAAILQRFIEKVINT